MSATSAESMAAIYGISRNKLIQALEDHYSAKEKNMLSLEE
jgi:hypothetical protein